VGYALSSAQRGYIAVDLALDSSYAPVIIENEAPTTTVRTVQLYIYDQATRAGFTGQDASQEMMIANDPDFTDAVWQPYTVESSWALTEGEGWKTVYVKTRDLLGRTVTAQDSIYFGASLPRDELDFAGASRFGTGFRLEQIDAGAWPQVQFSLDWVGDDSDPNFLSGGARFEDAAAIGGTAVRLSERRQRHALEQQLSGCAACHRLLSHQGQPQSARRRMSCGCAWWVRAGMPACACCAASISPPPTAIQEFAVPYRPGQRSDLDHLSHRPARRR
jgi:hypothetical protein